MNIKQQLEQVIAEMRSETRECRIAFAQGNESFIRHEAVDDWASRLSAIVEQMGAEPVGDKCPICNGIGKVGIPGQICELCKGTGRSPLATPQVPDGMVLVPEVLLRQIAKWLAESADPYDKAAYAINGLIAATKEEGE